MGRTRRIDESASSTTISLTSVQKLAIRKFQSKRLEETGYEPGLTEAVLEALELLLKAEGWSNAELGKAFPKVELKSSNISVFPRRSRRPRHPGSGRAS